MNILERLKKMTTSTATVRADSEGPLGPSARRWSSNSVFGFLPAQLLPAFSRNKAMSLPAELLVSMSLYFVLVVVFMLAFFPRQALERRIEAEIQRSSQSQVSVPGLRLTPFFSFVADEVNFPIKLPDATLRTLKIDDVSGHLHRLRLLFGTVMLTARGSFSGGTVDVQGRRLEDPRDWEFSLSSHDVNVNFLNEIVDPVRCVGLARIEGDMAVSGNRLTSVALSLDINDVTVNGLVVQEFTIEEVRADTITLKGGFSEGTITIERCSIVGPDLDAEFEGTIAVRNPFESSQLKISMGLRPKPDFLEKNELTFMRGFLASQGTGMISLPVRGTIKSPRVDFMSLVQPPR